MEKDTKALFDDILQKFLQKYRKENSWEQKSYLDSIQFEEVNSHETSLGLLGTFPEFFYRKYGFQTKRFKDQAEIWNPEKTDLSNQVQGILSCHALSPMGDSIFLFADIGRAARLAISFNKNLHILLADQDWSRYNWVAENYGGSNLSRNLEWRRGLYNAIGAEVEICGLHNVPGNITKYEIEKLGSAYEDMVRSIFGSEYLGRKLALSEVRDLHKHYTLKSSKDTRINFLNNPLVKSKIEPEKQVIFHISQSLRRLDQSTFIYYLTQRYHQYRYSNFLKIGVRSEKNFDDPFYRLDFGNENEGIKTAVYFEHYKLFDDTYCIPYYFPSGTLYNETTGKNAYHEQVIMLGDRLNTTKIEKVFGSMSYPYNARLIADLMSFTHALMFPLNSSDEQREFRTRIAEITKTISPELYKSWKYYVTPKEESYTKLKKWTHDVHIPALNEVNILPYFHFPFIDLANSNAKEKYVLYLQLLLEEVISITSEPLYHNE